jgi:CRISPR-associated exonuclease Cas4
MSEIVYEDKFFALSAINHYSFCPRRCALVHNEQNWSENFFTISGRQLHKVVEDGIGESRKDRKIARSIRLFSRELGISGISDVVEFIRDDEKGVKILQWQGRWMPYPVEYKRGAAKNDEPYKRQLCAQAICLEEMYGVKVFEGALYLGEARQRMIIAIDEKLRVETRETCKGIHKLLDGGITPKAELGPHCCKCSLVNECMPSLSSLSARRWINNQIEDV